jgi:hypothetical protein
MFPSGTASVMLAALMATSVDRPRTCDDTTRPSSP